MKPRFVQLAVLPAIDHVHAGKLFALDEQGRVYTYQPGPSGDRWVRLAGDDVRPEAEVAS